MHRLKSFKVGTVCLATMQGLGILAHDFFIHGLVDEVLIKQHSSRENHYEWYPNACKSEEELLSKINVLLLFEEAWDWKIIVRAREKGIKTVLIPMYECTRSPLPYQPDLIISPSLLDKQYYPDSIFIPIPVNVKHRIRSKVEVFVHNAGNGGLGGRNGTRELLEALEYVKSPIKLIVRSQIPIKEVKDPRIEYRIGTFDDIWNEGDVFVFPEKFNGLSLPMQEAFASGMLVMGGDRFPINTWLPKEPLIPVSGYHKERIAVSFDCAEYNVKDISKKIDEWYGKDITEYSLMGKKWGEENSWDNLKEIYVSTLKGL